MKKEKWYSYFLVALQFILIGLLALSSSLKGNIIYLLVFSIGIFLGFWAIFAMQKSKLRITPDVSENATLVKDGPYKYIRHPMYTSVLTASLGMFLSNMNSLTIIYYVFLSIVLFLKINYEEKLLRKAFGDYREYERKTKRLIPFLY